MSQIYKRISSSPAVAVEYDTDVNSPAIPAGNILNVVGGSSTSFTQDGIQTDGSSGGDTLTIQLTNWLYGDASTVGAVTDDAITFSMGATPSVRVFDIRIVGFDGATPAGVGFNLYGTVRTDGASATLVGTPDKVTNQEASLAAADVNLVVSANNAIVRVTGVAAVTLSWFAQGTYTQVT